MKFINFLLLLISFIVTVATFPEASISQQWLQELNEREVSDNITWMLIPNDRGELQLAILSGLQPETKADLPTDVKFYLYTSRSSSGYRLYVNDVNNLRASGYNAAKDTKILIHGFGGGISSGVIVDNRNAYFSVNDNYNVIGVDWGALCKSPDYLSATQNARLVGQYVGELVAFLIASGGASARQFHIIGHSLGAHVAGFAGANLKEKNLEIARITGLDAALPLYDGVHINSRLDATDAACVDNIHTCSGLLGYEDPHGDIDFYPNGGRKSMPGCGWLADIAGSCSHGKAVEYFMLSITGPLRYPSRTCNTLSDALNKRCTGTGTPAQYMGEGVICNRHGIYYTDTG